MSHHRCAFAGLPRQVARRLLVDMPLVNNVRDDLEVNVEFEMDGVCVSLSLPACFQGMSAPTARPSCVYAGACVCLCVAADAIARELYMVGVTDGLTVWSVLISRDYVAVLQVSCPQGKCADPPPHPCAIVVGVFCMRPACMVAPDAHGCGAPFVRLCTAVAVTRRRLWACDMLRSRMPR